MFLPFTLNTIIINTVCVYLSVYLHFSQQLHPSSIDWLPKICIIMPILKAVLYQKLYIAQSVDKQESQTPY